MSEEELENAFAEWTKKRPGWTPIMSAWDAFRAGHAAAQPKPVEWLRVADGLPKHGGKFWMTNGKDVFYETFFSFNRAARNFILSERYTHYAVLNPPAPPEQKE